MAEAFGVAAGAFSVIALLEQIIKSIEKLRSLRRFIKTIPQELQGLIDDIELVQGVLKTTTPDMLQVADIPSIERRLNAFQTDLETLISNVQKYQQSVTGRRMGAIKLFMKKEEILTQRRNLENIRNTLGSLQWTYCWLVQALFVFVLLASLLVVSCWNIYSGLKPYGYSITLRELGPIIRMQKLHGEKDDTESYEEPAENSQISRHRHKPKKAESQVSKKNSWELRFRAPLIFIDKIWSLQAKRCYSGWTFNIRTHNVVPDNAPILGACSDGDIEEIQRLFSAGLASVYDCNMEGVSLLHVAAYCHELAVCQLLFENGADPDHVDTYNYRPINNLNYRAPDLIENIPLAIELYRLFMNASVDSVDPVEDLGTQYDEYWFHGFRGPPEVLVIMQQYTFADYASLPLQTRFNRTMALNSFCATPSTVEISMGGSIEPDSYRLEDEFGRTLIYKLAEYMGSDLANEGNDATHKWRPLLRDAVAASTDSLKMAAIDDSALTPLSSFLRSFIWNWKAIRRARYDFNPALRTWVFELKSAGVDLEAYGAKESAFVEGFGLLYWIYVGPLRYRSIVTSEKEEDLFWFYFWKLTYGAEPEDWTIWVMNPIDELVGEFWEMVEREEEVMPGTWVD